MGWLSQIALSGVLIILSGFIIMLLTSFMKEINKREGYIVVTFG
jgi:hypothetical protein